MMAALTLPPMAGSVGVRGEGEEMDEVGKDVEGREE